MTEFYSRVASASLKKETTAEVAITPDVFFDFLAESISTEYGYTPSMPIEANRAKNIRPVDNKISAPNGSITLNVEPKKFGHFLNGVFGGVLSGKYMPIGTIVGTFTVGETITGGTSAATAVVVAVGNDYLTLSGGSGTFTAAETITGGSSGATAVVTAYSATVYGHVGVLPDNSIPTYTVQFNYGEVAIRYFGLRFVGFDSLAQQDNVITAECQVMAKGQFRHAYVTAITASGSGSKTLTMDQTLGLVAGDTIKVFRPSTGLFLDFLSAGVKTHTIGTVASATTITVTDLQTALAVGDLIVLAPQTASYSLGNEFTWIGGSEWKVGDAVSSLAVDCAEDFQITIMNEFEEKHGACGTDFEDRFPTTLLQKGMEASGQFTKYYETEVKYSKLRRNVQQAMQFKTQGAVITGTFRNEFRILFPAVNFDPYQTNISEDDLVSEEVPFTAFYNTTAAYSVRALLVNDVASY